MSDALRVISRFSLSLLLPLLAVALLGPSLRAAPQAVVVTRISVSSSQTQGNGSSQSPVPSDEGSYVVFFSEASDLVTDDTNEAPEVFLRNTQNGTTTRLAVGTSGEEANGRAINPALSSDGRYVAFVSEASNLVSGDSNAQGDIFLRDLQNGTTTRVSVSSSEEEANGPSNNPVLSSDGRYVAFDSLASNLVSGDTNDHPDVFLRDLQNGTTIRLSVSSSGVQSNGPSSDPALSSDGRYVAFHSLASNLVSGDTNEVTYDVFLRDTQSGTTTRISVNSLGTEGNAHSTNPALSSDGRYVVFHSLASNLVSGDFNASSDVFLYDTADKSILLISRTSRGVHGDEGSIYPSISANGCYIAFQSAATNLVGGDSNNTSDIFLHDRLLGTTTRLSVHSSGAQGNGPSFAPTISADGRYVAFDSGANTLVDADTNNVRDSFLATGWPVEECHVRRIYLPLGMKE